MIGLWAWTDFIKFVHEFKEELNLQIDTIPLDENAPMLLSEARGGRKALQKILDYIEGTIS